jgi:hypothetical protein
VDFFNGGKIRYDESPERRGGTPERVSMLQTEESIRAEHDKKPQGQK